MAASQIEKDDVAGNSWMVENKLSEELLAKAKMAGVDKGEAYMKFVEQDEGKGGYLAAELPAKALMEPLREIFEREKFEAIKSSLSGRLHLSVAGGFEMRSSGLKKHNIERKKRGIPLGPQSYRITKFVCLKKKEKTGIMIRNIVAITECAGVDSERKRWLGTDARSQVAHITLSRLSSKWKKKWDEIEKYGKREEALVVKIGKMGLK